MCSSIRSTYLGQINFLSSKQMTQLWYEQIERKNEHRIAMSHFDELWLQAEDEWMKSIMSWNLIQLHLFSLNFRKFRLVSYTRIKLSVCVVNGAALFVVNDLCILSMNARRFASWGLHLFIYSFSYSHQIKYTLCGAQFTCGHAVRRALYAYRLFIVDSGILSFRLV